MAKLIFCLLMLAAVPIVFAQKTRVVFFGDSITELGVKPDGYISRIGELAKTEGAGDRFELVGAGIGGNKIYDLYLRVDDDVIKRSPDIVVVFVGVNDVWHKKLLGTGTDFDKFGKFYEALADKLRAAKIKVVVCTPAVIGERTDFTNDSDGDLNLYSKWIREFAARRSLPLVDLRKAFLERNLAVNKDNSPSGILTTDRVHLNPAGNDLVAKEIWGVLKEIK